MKGHSLWRRALLASGNKVGLMTGCVWVDRGGGVYPSAQNKNRTLNYSALLVLTEKVLVILCVHRFVFVTAMAHTHKMHTHTRNTPRHTITVHMLTV